MSSDSVHIVLRKLEPEDLPFIYRWENDGCSWLDGGVHNPISQKDLRDYISSSTGDIYHDGQLRLMITTKDDCTVGCIDLYDFDAFNAKAAVGLYIDPYYRGKGYAKKAMLQLIDYSFNILSLRQLYAIVSVGNGPSVGLFNALGFEKTATLRCWTKRGDANVFQLLNE